MFVLRLGLNLVYFLLVVVPLQAIGSIVLLPLVYLYPGYQKLPRCFRWFDNADMYVGRDTSVYEAVANSSPWARYCWLAWRNPLNYYGYKVRGILWDGTEDYVKYLPWEQDIGDSTGDRPGLRYIEVVQKSTGRLYYEYYYIHKWSNTTCFRFRLGWKISDNKNKLGSYTQDCFVVSPFKSYSGV